MAAVFLSAGIPDQPARGPYVETSDPIAIRDAVRALTAVCLTKGHELVFGGHPAITPLVWQVADSLGMSSRVFIFQSQEFKDAVPREARFFENIVWVPSGETRAESLRLLRTRMLGSRQFIAAVFIGGMDGVEAEYALFRRMHPNVRVFPVFTTGGAAKNLSEQTRGLTDTELGRSHSYHALFREVLGNDQS